MAWHFRRDERLVFPALSQPASGVERQQLKWVAYVVILALVAFAVLAPAPVRTPSFFVADACPADLAGAFFIVRMPLCTGAAILRYRLYEIDSPGSSPGPPIESTPRSGGVSTSRGHEQAAGIGLVGSASESVGEPPDPQVNLRAMTARLRTDHIEQPRPARPSPDRNG